MDVKGHIRNRIEEAAACYVKDFEAIAEEDLARSPGGTARSPFDFTYEVVVVNKRIAARLRRETPPPLQREGWMTAPEEFKSKQGALQAFSASVNEVLAAWDHVSPSHVDDAIETPSGHTTALEMASLCASHLTYHDAQLNYFQSLQGDSEMHWF